MLDTPPPTSYQAIRWNVVARGIVSPEGPAEDPAQGVYLVSRWTGRVVRVDLEGNVSEVVHTEGKPQAVALLPSGDLLLADAKNHALCRITSEGSIAIVADKADGQRLLGPNDLCVADGEIVYMTDPGLHLQEPGRIVRADARTGRATILADGYRFPNGITLTGDGRYLVVAESVTHRVLRFELLDDGRQLGPPEVYYEFPDHYPDGIAFDAAGNLLVTLHGAGTLNVVNPSGVLVASIPTGGKGATNCVFGGDDFRTLYVTEDDQQALLSTRWPIPGQRRFSRSKVLGESPGSFAD